MTKALAIILTIVGGICLIIGIIGIFGANLVSVSPWALAILGIIFFSAGIGILKRRSSNPAAED